jgi:hypothetical protein
LILSSASMIPASRGTAKRADYTPTHPDLLAIHADY